MGATPDRLMGGILVSAGITLGASGTVLLFTGIAELLAQLLNGHPLATSGVFFSTVGILLVAMGWTFLSLNRDPFRDALN